jgi:hypothetical protein
LDAAHYSIAEVVFLLSISRSEAISFDADPVSWLGRLQQRDDSGGTGGGSSEGPPSR